MTLEDFTTYTEVDPNSHIGLVGTNHVDFKAYKNEDAYLYKDKGAGHFTDFEHKIDVKLISADNTGQGFVWALANLVDDWKGIDDANGSALGVFLYGSVATYYLYLRELYLGTAYNDSCSINLNTPYYLTIKRVGNAFTCKVYTDSARTNLYATLSLNLQAGQPNHRYVYASQTLNSASTYTLDCDVENLDLQEAAGVAHSKSIAEKVGFVDGHGKVQHHKKTVAEKVGFVDEHDKDKCKKCEPSSVILTF